MPFYYHIATISSSQIYECYKHPYIPEVLKNEEGFQQAELNNQQPVEVILSTRKHKVINHILN